MFFTLKQNYAQIGSVTFTAIAKKKKMKLKNGVNNTNTAITARRIRSYELLKTNEIGALIWSWNWCDETVSFDSLFFTEIQKKKIIYECSWIFKHKFSLRMVLECFFRFRIHSSRNRLNQLFECIQFLTHWTHPRFSCKHRTAVSQQIDSIATGVWNCGRRAQWRITLWNETI